MDALATLDRTPTVIPSRPIDPLARLDATISDLRRDTRAFVADKPAGIQSLALSTRGSLKNILKGYRANPNEPIDTYVTVCPIYDGKGGISGDYGSFAEVPVRFRQKFDAGMGSVEFLAERLPLRVNLLLADQGVLVGPSYDRGRFPDDMAAISDLYARELAGRMPGARMTSFSEIGLDLEPMNAADPKLRTSDARAILRTNGVPDDSFVGQLAIIERAFGASGAYFFLRNYLEESRFLGKNFRNKIFVNVEACGPLNSAYELGTPGTRAIDSNVLAKANINI